MSSRFEVRIAQQAIMWEKTLLSRSLERTKPSSEYSVLILRFATGCLCRRAQINLFTSIRHGLNFTACNNSSYHFQWRDIIECGDLQDA